MTGCCRRQGAPEFGLLFSEDRDLVGVVWAERPGVLLLLHEAPQRRLRMSELASSALLSLSGMTRLVDRLVDAGLVERERCDEDKRVLYARPTRAGSALFATARATHLRGIRELYLDRFSEGDLGRLAEVWQRLA